MWKHVWKALRKNQMDEPACGWPEDRQKGWTLAVCTTHPLVARWLCALLILWLPGAEGWWESPPSEGGNHKTTNESLKGEPPPSSVIPGHFGFFVLMAFFGMTILLSFALHSGQKEQSRKGEAEDQKTGGEVVVPQLKYPISEDNRGDIGCGPVVTSKTSSPDPLEYNPSSPSEDSGEGLTLPVGVEEVGEGSETCVKEPLLIDFSLPR